jgi:phage terminase Nu1 subunit (DNA packaging protein)
MAETDPKSGTYPIATIAKLLELTERRVYQLAAQGVIPRTPQGRYELIPAVRGYIRFLRDRAINADVKEGEEGDHKKRLMGARADIAEHEAKRLSGELVPVAHVARVWIDAAANVRARLLSIPQKTAPLVSVETDIERCHAVIETQIHEALSELAGVEVVSTTDTGGDASENAEDDGAAAETDDLGMGGSVSEAEQRI